MELSQLAFHARNRTPWQVFDLTQLMVRKHFFSLLKIALSFYLPVMLVVLLLLPSDYAMWILWWLKPLVERPLLTYLAKASFSQKTTTWQCIKSLKELSVIQIIRMLTWYRFSPNRAYLASVEQLEKLTSKRKTSRSNLLLGRCNHKQTFWIMFCIHAEMIFTFLLMLMAYNFIPAGVTIDDQIGFTGFVNSISPTLVWTYSLCYLISTVLVMPYFVTGGFLMYLNGRIKLEGWDIELAFKRIAKASTYGFIAALFWLPIAPSPVYAQTAEQVEVKKVEDIETKTVLEPTERAIQTKQAIEKLYQDNEWIEKQTTWQPKEKQDKSSFDFSWLKNLASIGTLISYVAWGVVICLVVWVFILMVRHHEKFLPKKRVDIKTKPTELPVFFDSLPADIQFDDLLSMAKKANNENNFRLALMCILKFSFHLAEQKSDIKIHKSMSEMECQRALLKVLPDVVHEMYKTMFSLWIQQAWAHRDVEQLQVSELISGFERIGGAENE